MDEEIIGDKSACFGGFLVSRLNIPQTAALGLIICGFSQNASIKRTSDLLMEN